ncbi:DUF883 family protein [Pseudoduganella umbonata]|uniref:DUF883 domain-containing protein n=1 Tax=Pseudoduganella umbonata TaxID=864828 RepID=A0A4P8HXV7_9BURK|nr:DUF883 family protein [Pseudoduganella umbonata]MBB3224615.1 ElaB/YqjD/DUF883 family membrane-anchored ribosome-binding protein [Pseudoduganella umbonata]QCP13374.1 DUF883 domain-containing protein [Pseudoduganella umbonata]
MDQTNNPTASNGITAGTGTIGSDTGAARERLLGDLKNAIGEAEHWLRSAASSSADGAEEAKSQFKETLRSAKTNLLTLEDTALAKGKLAAQCADTYVHDNPWRSVVIGAVVGLLAGVIIARD